MGIYMMSKTCNWSDVHIPYQDVFILLLSHSDARARSSQVEVPRFEPWAKMVTIEAQSQRQDFEEEPTTESGEPRIRVVGRLGGRRAGSTVTSTQMLAEV